MIVRNILAGLGVVALAGAAAVGISAYGTNDPSQDPPPRLNVSYRGLDLATPGGIESLDARIAAAIDEVCGYDRTRGLGVIALEQRCRANAAAAVRPQVDAAIARAHARAAGRTFNNGSVLADLERQPSGIRRAITAAIGRAVEHGITANWYGWSAHGFVYVGAPAPGEGDLCRFVTVTDRRDGVYETLTQGAVCRTEDNLLYVPGTR